MNVTIPTTGAKSKYDLPETWQMPKFKRLNDIFTLLMRSGLSDLLFALECCPAGANECNGCYSLSSYSKALLF